MCSVLLTRCLSALERPLICAKEPVVEVTSTLADIVPITWRLTPRKTLSDSSLQPGKAELPTQGFLCHEFVAISSRALLWIVGNFLFSALTLTGQQSFNWLSTTHYLHTLPRYLVLGASCLCVCVLMTCWPNFFVEWITLFCQIIPPPLSSNRAYSHYSEAIATNEDGVIRKSGGAWKTQWKILSLRGNLYWSNANVQVWCPYGF